MRGLEWEQASNTFVLNYHSEGKLHTTQEWMMFKEVHDSVIWIFYRQPQFLEFEYGVNLKMIKHSNYFGICSGALVINWNVLLGCLVAK